MIGRADLGPGDKREQWPGLQWDPHKHTIATKHLPYLPTTHPPPSTTGFSQPPQTMSSLNSLLNPESTQERDMRMQQIQSGSTSPPVFDMAYERMMAQTSYYAQSDVIIRPHEPHPDCPDTLACLPDTNGRPQHTLPVILRCAILGSPKRRLTIREIYAAMEKKYPYYKTAGPAWKQSVRHHLSLNRLFERQPRPATDPGFGSYWTVNLEAPPGTKRPRKRGRAQKEAQVQSTTVADKSPYNRPPPPPPRTDLPHSGHPPIATLRPVDAHSFRTSAVRVSPYDDDEDDEEEMPWEGGAPIVMSDDDYDSEERSPYHYNPPMSASSSNTAGSFHQAQGPPRQPARSGSNGTSYPSPYGHSPTQDPAIERLKQEIEGLKRQTTDQEHLTLRLSNQLTRAEAEIIRAKHSLKMAESRLEDEIRRRVEAERAADEEAKMRRSAEDNFRMLQLQTQRITGHSSSVMPL